MWWKTNKRKVIVAVLIVAVLAVAFWCGGGAPGLQGVSDGDTDTTLSQTQTTQPKPAVAARPKAEEPEGKETPADADEPDTKPAETTPTAPAESIESRPGGTDGGLSGEQKLDAAAELAGAASAPVEAGDKDYSQSQSMAIDPNTGKDQFQTEPVPEGKPLPVEPQDATVSDTAYTCTLSISCATIFNHIEWLDQEKVELMPEDGWILKPTPVTFYEGESVFNVLQRTCKQQQIHMEFENTPVYNSAYIEGIHNLYEFDCGELSGWMYQVNGWFPNYGCSRYQLQDGDVIDWVYTCDMGADVGGYNNMEG